ncbi:MAG: hypothetical protein Q9197_004432 [Variospora fuerteventurae]
MELYTQLTETCGQLSRAEQPPEIQPHHVCPSSSLRHGSRSQDHHRPILRMSSPSFPPLLHNGSLSLHSTTPPIASYHTTANQHSAFPLHQVLAIGFLLVILSSALWRNYLPLLVVATYIVAPLPNWICGRCANPDDFMESSGSAVMDFGRFCTGVLVVMGVGRCNFAHITFFFACPFPKSRIGHGMLEDDG